ncbi:MAG: hypothetical protein WC159_09795 [Sphaerochaetaceae bacterium]
MKKWLVVFLCGVFCSSIFASPSQNDVIVAVAAITDSCIVNCAGYVASHQYILPGCTLAKEERQALPSSLILSQSDLSHYLAVIPPPQENGNWFSQLVSSASGPLDKLARTYLTVHDWKEGEALLTGTVVPLFPVGLGLSDIFSSVLTAKPLEPIETLVDVWVRGSRLSMPVHVKGTFEITNTKEQGLSIKPKQLEATGV